jgi:Protein of unknown function (DUF2510)
MSDPTNTTPPPPQIPAGWYDDGSGQQRYWDGNQWTAAQPIEASTVAPSPTVKSRKGLWIALAVVGGVLLLLIIAAVIAGISGAARLAAEDGAVPSSEPEPSVASEPSDEPQAPEEQKAEELEVSDEAFGRETDQDYWWYAAIIENPNTDYVFPSTSIDVEALDADGVILDSSSEYVTILPGKIAITGTFFDIGNEKISSIELRGPTADSAIHSPADETGFFKVSPVEIARDDYSTTASGNLTSGFSEEQSLVSVVVVARGSDGSIIKGDRTYVDRLPSEGTARFEVRFFELFPEGTTFEAYPVL